MGMQPTSPVLREGKVLPPAAMLPTHLHGMDKSNEQLQGFMKITEKLDSLRITDECGWYSVILIILVDCHMMFAFTE